MNDIINTVEQWLNQVVIGLNLCPFASKPMGEKRVRFYLSQARDEEQLFNELFQELLRLDAAPVTELETTLMIVPDYLQNFFEYSQFLHWAESWLKRNGWRGVYQIASFHPEYCFAGADPEDAENLTNRSPYPILHLLREDSVSQALAFYPDIEQVPINNRRRVNDLSAAEKKRLFSYLLNP